MLDFVQRIQPGCTPGRVVRTAPVAESIPCISASIAWPQPAHVGHGVTEICLTDDGPAADLAWPLLALAIGIQVKNGRSAFFTDGVRADLQSGRVSFHHAIAMVSVRYLSSPSLPDEAGTEGFTETSVPVSTQAR